MASLSNKNLVPGISMRTMSTNTMVPGSSSSSCSSRRTRTITSRKAGLVGSLFVSINQMSMLSTQVAALGEDMENLFQAETKCPVFQCKEGEVAMQKPAGTKKKDWPVVYGCDASAFDMMMMMDASSLQNGMPKKGGNSIKLRKCCVGRDIGQQVCGMTKAELEGTYGKCSTKKCKGDQSCKMSANFGIMMGGGMMGGDKCKEYNDFQSANCICVPKEKEEETFMKAVEDFYTTFAKNKLPKTVDEKWLGETVYKKFKKTEKPQIWYTLFEKYSSSLQHKERPKPDYGADLGDLDKDLPKAEKTKPKTEPEPEPEEEVSALEPEPEIVEEEL